MAALQERNPLREKRDENPTITCSCHSPGGAYRDTLLVQSPQAYRGRRKSRCQRTCQNSFLPERRYLQIGNQEEERRSPRSFKYRLAKLENYLAHIVDWRCRCSFHNSACAVSPRNRPCDRRKSVRPENVWPG